MNPSTEEESELLFKSLPSELSAADLDSAIEVLNDFSTNLE